MTRAGPVVIGGCVALLLALRLIAGGSESAGGPGPVRLPIPTPTADELCQAFGRYWTVEAGITATADDIAAISDCRQDASGGWFEATGPDDPRLAGGPILSDAERASTASLRGEILAQVEGLVARLPADLRRGLDGLYDPDHRPGSGHLREGGRPGELRARYERAMRRYLIDPDHRVLAEYVTWLTERRAAAWGQIAVACQQPEPAAVGCGNMREALGIDGVPWTWDLEDPLILEDYLAWTLERGG